MKFVPMDLKGLDGQDLPRDIVAPYVGGDAALPLLDALDDVPYYHDGRGLARAQLGDLAGAAQDFTLFADWLEAEYPLEWQLIDDRRAWIAALERGENPITAEVLAGMK